MVTECAVSFERFRSAGKSAGSLYLAAASSEPESYPLNRRAAISEFVSAQKTRVD